MPFHADPPAPTVVAVEATTVAPEPEMKAGAGFLVLYDLANFGLYLTVMMPALFSLPYKVGLLAPHDKIAVLGLVATAGAVVGLVTGPLAGLLSDRTDTRFGRRRPWFIGGVLALGAGSVVVAFADSIVMLLLGWIVVSVGGAANAAAIIPVVAARVPEAQRGSVAAIIGVATQLAGVLGYAIGSLVTMTFAVVSGTMSDKLNDASRSSWPLRFCRRPDSC